MYCLGTNILHNFGFLKKLTHIILYSHFNLFKNGLIDLLTPKGSHFIYIHTNIYVQIRVSKIQTNKLKKHFFSVALCFL